MRTGRSLTVCCSLLPGRGAGPGVCSRGGACPRGVSAWGVCSGGCLPQGGAWSGGVSTSWGGWGGYPSMHWGRHPSPPVDRHTLVKILPWPNFVAAGNKYSQWTAASPFVVWKRETDIWFNSARVIPLKVKPSTKYLHRMIKWTGCKLHALPIAVSNSSIEKNELYRSKL